MLADDDDDHVLAQPRGDMGLSDMGLSDMGLMTWSLGRPGGSRGLLGDHDGYLVVYAGRGGTRMVARVERVALLGMQRCVFRGRVVCALRSPTALALFSEPLVGEGRAVRRRPGARSGEATALNGCDVQGAQAARRKRRSYQFERNSVCPRRAWFSVFRTNYSATSGTEY